MDEKTAFNGNGEKETKRGRFASRGIFQLKVESVGLTESLSAYACLDFNDLVVGA